MRSADLATLLRILFLFLIVYAIAVKVSALVVLPAIIVLFLSDAADGYLALTGRHALPDFFSYALEEARLIRKKRGRSFPKNIPRYAAYVDIAGDRAIEYAFWLLFTLLSLLPWFVIAIFFIRNTTVDAVMISRKKDFSKMRTPLGRVASSHLSRGAYGALKAANFMYLALVVVANWPPVPGYALTSMTLAYSLIRGVAEVGGALGI